MSSLLKNEQTLSRLSDLADRIDELILATQLQKDVLTHDEAAHYLGISKDHLYKLTSRKSIPHYKPSGKLNYFKRSELNDWMTSSRIASDEELPRIVSKHIRTKT